MYKDKEKQREKARERIRRYRDKQKGVTNPVDSVTQSPDSVTLPSSVTSEGITINQEEAVKLLKICGSLDRTISTLSGTTNMLELVRFGSIRMDDVRDRILNGEWSD